jgi:hypothetical protein
MDLTIYNISFLKDIDSSIKVDMRTGWRHHYFDGLSIDELSYFLKSIGDHKIYLLIPLFAGSKSFSNATLNLSEPFLVNNKSNSVLITNFIMDQWDSSGFNIHKDTLITFSFKFKRVWFSSSF